jgi:hypothetical protein
VGDTSAETYVVCLDCAKQFTYDWDNMRVGRPIELPAQRRTQGGKGRLRYAAWAATLPAAWLIGSAFRSRKRTSQRPEEDSSAGAARRGV